MNIPEQLTGIIDALKLEFSDIVIRDIDEPFHSEFGFYGVYFDIGNTPWFIEWSRKNHDSMLVTKLDGHAAFTGADFRASSVDDAIIHIRKGSCHAEEEDAARSVP